MGQRISLILPYEGKICINLSTYDFESAARTVNGQEQRLYITVLIFCTVGLASVFQMIRAITCMIALPW